jgi:MauM/NapG family ferredoxin protein
MISRGRRLRLYVQLPFLVAAVALLWPVPFWEEAPRFFVQTSSFIAICSGIAFKTIGVGIGIGWTFGLIALAKNRWYCRYVCPTGLLLEGATHIGLRKTFWWTRLPPLGQYIALLTAISAVIGYPLFLWMDPLAIFSNYFAIRTAGNVISGFLAGFGLGVLILLSVTSGSVWCSRLCPLGGTLDLLSSAKGLFQDIKKAGFKHSPFSSAPGANAGLMRRTFILGALGLGFGLWAKKIGAMRGENAPLRPPGAIREKAFTGACIRCGNCVRSCPSKILYADTGKAGLAGFMAPTVRFEKNYCIENCLACTQICPSGALQRLDLQHKRKYVIGEALVDGSLCLLALGQKDCDVCMRSCPFKAIRINWDEEQYIAYPVVDPVKCNGCGACEFTCPTADIKAIQVWKNLD